MILIGLKGVIQMKLSKKFLANYIDLNGIDFTELANKMVFTGNEFDSIDTMCEATDLKIGHVLDCVNHPDSDHLHICKVDLKTEVKQIICGAPNVAKNQNVIVATIGATLPGGLIIKKANLAGMESEGMICSLEELGIPTKYLKEEDKTGIHVLPESAPIGEDALPYLALDDEIIDFDLTADRGDLLSVLGMAYEAGAIYDRNVVLPNTEVHPIETTMDQYKLNVQTKDCSIYLGRVVEQVQVTESPEWLKSRLIASGIRPINNVVDISNFVMLELGQPLHFFDADKLGSNIIVRNAQEGETLLTLDKVERTLSETDIVIANEDGPVALAGVMGGFETEVTESTKNIFIESAIFDSIHIRLTSKKILRSEASNRFEKGIDPNRTEMALNRACHLLEELAGGKAYTGMVSYDVASKEEKKIELTLEKINQVLGMELTESEVKDTLRRLNFRYTDTTPIQVFVPTRRMDVVIKEDLIAEIGKIYGYQHVSLTLPTIPVKSGKRSYKGTFIRSIKTRLQGLGLQEVITYSLVGEAKTTRFQTKTLDPVCLENPLTEDHKYMRTSLIPSLLQIVEYNRSRNMEDIRLFECGAVYSKQSDCFQEEPMIAGVLAGTYMNTSWKNDTKNVDFYVVKGIMEHLLNYLGLTGRYDFVVDAIPNEMHPGRSASIKLDNEMIGYFGQVHPSLSKKETYVFELSLEKLLKKKVRTIKYKEASKFPSVHKDLAFVVEKETTAKEVSDILKRVGGRLLTELTVFDVYVGENVLENQKSLAFSLTFQEQTRTLTDEEVTAIFTKMIETVTSKLNATLRDK